MNARDMIRESFSPMFGIEPERPVEPDEPPEVSLDIAIKRLRASLVAGPGSQYWTYFSECAGDEIDDRFVQKFLLAVRDDEALIAHDLAKEIWEKALRQTADAFIDELGVLT